MGSTAAPVPTTGPVLVRRAGATICGVDSDGSAKISCPLSSTCAVTTNSVNGKIYAGCHSSGDVIATSCTDVPTACDSCTEDWLRVCAGNLYCATRYWYASVTGEFEKPLATSIFCNARQFIQPSGTYLPVEFGVWNSAPLTDLPPGQTKSTSLQAHATSTSGPATEPSSTSAQALSTGAIAGIAAGGAALLLMAISAFVLLRRRKRASMPLSGGASTYLSGRDNALGTGADADASSSYPLDEKSDHGPVQKLQEQAQHPAYNPSHSISEGNMDNLGSLPRPDEMRNLRTMGGVRGAPSVMTDMSETLTLGDNADVDDIHAIGHSR